MRSTMGFFQKTTPSQIIYEKLFSDSTPPGTVIENESYALGMKFRVSVSGKIHGCRYWRTPLETGNHIGKIWDINASLLSSVDYQDESASGWQQQLFTTPLAVTPGQTYVVSVNINYSYILLGGGLASSIVNGNIFSVDDNQNGVFTTNINAFPTGNFNESNYYIDILFLAD
jgi:hypothetical protein